MQINAKNLYLLFICLILTISLNTYADKAYQLSNELRPLTEQEKAHVTQVVKDSLYGRDKEQLDSMLFIFPDYNGNAKGGYCGLVNTKSNEGQYLGYKPFILWFKLNNKHELYTDSAMASNPDYDATKSPEVIEHYLKVCKNTEGYDLQPLIDKANNNIIIKLKNLYSSLISWKSSIAYTPPKLDQVKTKSLQEFIFVKGGTFTMGDFGQDFDGQHYPLISFMRGKQEASPHQVTLDNFSLSKNKVTWFDYDTFLLDTHKPLLQIEYRHPTYEDIQNNEPSSRDLPFEWKNKRKPYNQGPAPKTYLIEYNINTPAIAQWQDAKDYCQWLGKKLDLPVDLATEAQWEYAARSGGYKVLFANKRADFEGKSLVIDMSEPLDPKKVAMAKKENITLIDGASIPSSWNLPWDQYAPIGTLSTPNRLGFNDMDYNGEEWVNDWWSATYFQKNPKITNPQGPSIGKNKVVKGLHRYPFSRSEYTPKMFATFRCAIQSDNPVSQ